jgi:hypothetical protein
MGGSRFAARVLLGSRPMSLCRPTRRARRAYGLTATPTRQTGVLLLKTAWEWAAVLGQVEVHGWQKLDMR